MAGVSPRRWPAAAPGADGPLECSEQPCATVAELAELRRRVDVPTADESIRKAEDPLAVVARPQAADIAVLKVAPLGGISALCDIAARIAFSGGLRHARDSTVGIAAD